MLHNLEAGELLHLPYRIVDGKVRKYYRITPLGRVVLDEARDKVLDLVNEVTDVKPPTSRDDAAQG